MNKIQIDGYVIRGHYDAFTHTNLKFICNENDDILYLPVDIMCESKTPMGEKIMASIVIELLDKETKWHQYPKCILDTMPSLYGWVSRANKKAWHEKSHLCFSTHKPTEYNGYFEDKEHTMFINENEFPQVKEMGEPIPAAIYFSNII